MKKILYLILFLSLGFSAISGNSDKEKTTSKTIAGKITDVYGEAIPGASFTIVETKETFFADMDGNFKMNLKTDQEYSISINTMGFEPLKVSSNNLTSFSELTLKPL